MAVPSTMLPLGTAVPAFALPDAVTGRTVPSAEFGEARALLVMFVCNHCPYVQHVLPELGRVARDYVRAGLAVVGINANDLDAYPQDGPPNMKRLAESEGWTFPFLMDATQTAARAFRAACTPDFFLFDDEHRLVYRGQLDGSRPGNDTPVTGRVCARPSRQRWPANRCTKHRRRAWVATSSGVRAMNPTTTRGPRDER